MIRSIGWRKIFNDNTDRVDFARKLDMTPAVASYALREVKK
ncbi:MAG TPA: hypothetical protein VMW91_06445 [Desulfosporosinus sp.]|nr:hypothetical protein [Desulfosporosinus sp.]